MTVAERVTLHALGWLAAGNAAGLLLATLLLVPDLGGALGPLGYGRWMPVHLDAQLYGWCALPLVGLLFRLYLPGGARGDRLAAVALAAWSGALAAGCASWLAGRTGGKPFLEWSGPARWLWLGQLGLLLAVLAGGFASWLRTGRLRTARRAGQIPRRAEIAGRAALLAGLAAVPVALWAATRPEAYPPVNPASGGPTGVSLLGSTLGIVWLLVASPWLLGLEPRAAAGARGAARRLVAALALHTAAFVALAAFAGGDRSHHEPLQIAALASVALWPLPLIRHLRRWHWPAGAGRWPAALGAWGLLLAATAVPTFLPGVLERWKFTDALVGHAHLAMAGMVTSFGVLALASLLRGGRLDGLFAARRPFALWHGGGAAMLAAMLAAGTVEGTDPAAAVRGGALVTALYGVRWAAGAAMLAASAAWLRAALAGRVPAAAPGIAATPAEAWPAATAVARGTVPASTARTARAAATYAPDQPVAVAPAGGTA